PGCTKPPPPPPPPSTCESVDELLLQLGIGASGLSTQQRTNALNVVWTQLEKRLKPGFGGLTINAYPLTSASFTAAPLRLHLACIPFPIGPARPAHDGPDRTGQGTGCLSARRR